MKRTGLTHRLTAWLVCLAMLFAVLVPTVSVAAPGAGWLEVCTADGAKLVKVDSDGAPSAATDTMAKHGEHCAFCLIHIDTAGPAASIASTLHPVANGRIYPPLFLHAPPRFFTWAPAQSRAPPCAS